MAKNLKLNIKNAQLAEALKINQIKKPSATKKGSSAKAPEAKIEETKIVSSSEPTSHAPAQEKATEISAANPPVEKSFSEPQALKEPAKDFQEKSPQAYSAPSSFENKPRGSYEDRPPQSQYQQSRSFERRPQEGSSYSQSGPRYDRPHSDRPGYQGQQSSDTRFSRPQGSQTGDTRFSRPQGSQTGDTRFSRPQGSQSGDTRFSRPQGSQSGDTRFSRPQGSQSGDTRFSRPQGSHTGDTRFSRPQGSQSGDTKFSRPQGSQTGDTRFSRPPFDRSGPRPQSGQYGAPRPPFRREGLPPPDVKKAFPSSKDHPVREAPPVKKAESEDDKFPRKALPQKDGKDQKGAKKVDAHKSFDSRDRHGLRAGDEEVWRKKKSFKSKHQMQEEVIRPKSLKVRIPISVKDLAAEMKLKASQLIAKLFMQGVAITLNDLLDDETTIQLLGHEFECEISIDTAEEKRIQVTDKSIKDEILQAPQDALRLRPPVVTFMGHVDHGKTSLIDAIRKSNRVATEAGAITQHIGAFKCQTAVGNITVLDTPGHEAFSAMRSRGAEVTDIAVLVVAGDEGMKAQTLEALSQAQAAAVPIVVAINKCDRPGFNAETVYRQLADNNLLPEAWGGATITVNCSALTGDGIKDLLEMLALQAEVLELRANPEARARGSVIESEMHKGLGAVATILIQNGTLRVGDSIVFGQHYARVKTMHDEFGKELISAGPSTPVKITGLSNLASAGSEFVAVKDEKEAREISEMRTEGHKSNLLLQSKKGSLENLLQQRADKVERKTLNLIVKADVQGSLEALKTSLLKIPSKKVDICFISEGVGEISESDIQFAATSKATIIGFHTKIESHAEGMIKQLKVNVRLHDIIYHAVDDTKELMLALLDKIAQENEIGKAEVRTVFKSSHLGNIAGCQVVEGTIKRSCIVKVLRENEQVWKGPISSLKRVKEDVKEVSKGIECGIVLQNFGDIKQGDMIHAIEITYLTQDLN